MFTTTKKLDELTIADFIVQDWSIHKPKTFRYMGKWIYNWFSNFQNHEILIDDIKWPSVENYYQAMKTTNTKLQEDIRTMSASESKKFGRKLKIREDWEQMKVQVMLKALRAKWSQPTWKEKLLATNNEVLVEWNNWGDAIWGANDSTGKGQNILGILLMLIRDELRRETN